MKRKLVKRLSSNFPDTREETLSNVDEGIQDIIADLNFNHGFRTWMSCEGGVEHDSPGAWISLEDTEGYGPEDWEELKEVIKSHTDIPFKVVVGKGDGAVVSFASPLREPYFTREDLKALPPRYLSFFDPDLEHRTKWVRGEVNLPELDKDIV